MRGGTRPDPWARRSPFATRRGGPGSNVQDRQQCWSKLTARPSKQIVRSGTTASAAIAWQLNGDRLDFVYSCAQAARKRRHRRHGAVIGDARDDVQPGPAISAIGERIAVAALDDEQSRPRTPRRSGRVAIWVCAAPGSLFGSRRADDDAAANRDAFRSRRCAPEAAARALLSAEEVIDTTASPPHPAPAPLRRRSALRRVRESRATRRPSTKSDPWKCGRAPVISVR